MQTFTRPNLTGGVALIGASAIALSPVVVAPQQVHQPALSASNLETTLTASVDPIGEWVKVLTTTLTNIADLGQQMQADPAPILAQIIANQIDYATITSTALTSAGSAFVAALTALPAAFSQAAQQLSAGQISAGLNTAFQAVLQLVQSPGFALLQSPILSIPGQVLQNATNFVNVAPGFIVTAGLSAISTVNGVASAFEDTAQAVYDAVGAGDFGAAANAVVNAPALLTNAFLNGYTPTGAWGILTPISAGLGFVPVLVGFRDVFAQALGAPVSYTAAVASPRAAAALPTPAGGPTSVSELPTRTGNPITVALKTEPKVQAPLDETPDATVTPDAAGIASETSTTLPTDAGDAPTGAVGSEASTGSNPATIVHDGAKAIPGKAGTKRGNPGQGLTKAINSAGENLKSSLNKMGDGLKNSFGKSAKPSRGGSDRAGTSSGSDSGR